MHMITNTLQRPRRRAEKSNLAIVSLVLGIVALVGSFWIMAAIGIVIGIFVDLALGVTSLCLGISALRRNGSGLAIAGITLGAVSCAFSGLMVLNFLRIYAQFGRII
jgi:hypothetical protein